MMGARKTSNLATRIDELLYEHEILLHLQGGGPLSQKAVPSAKARVAACRMQLEEYVNHLMLFADVLALMVPSKSCNCSQCEAIRDAGTFVASYTEVEE